MRINDMLVILDLTAEANKVKQVKALDDVTQPECKKQRPRFKFSMVNIPQ